MTTMKEKNVNWKSFFMPRHWMTRFESMLSFLTKIRKRSSGSQFYISMSFYHPTNKKGSHVRESYECSIHWKIVKPKLFVKNFQCKFQSFLCVLESAIHVRYKVHPFSFDNFSCLTKHIFEAWEEKDPYL